MYTEEKDTQIEDQVDFEISQEIDQEELTQEVKDFDQQEEEKDSYENPEVSTTVDFPEQVPAEPLMNQPELGTQETSSFNRVISFEDFVNKKD